MTVVDIPRANGTARAVSPGRDRRETERVISYWESKLKALGGEVTVAALDLPDIGTPEWAHRFLIAVDPQVERSSLVLYGARFADLLHLPETPRPDRPMLRQLPSRYGEVFLGGCAEIRKEMAPVRLDGEVERSDGKVELYRAGFIPVAVKPQALTWFAFGAFNCRLAEPTLAA